MNQSRAPFPSDRFLSILACVLASLAVLNSNGVMQPAVVEAGVDQLQPEEMKMPFNAAEQRKRMMAQLDHIYKRLGNIERALDAGISVKVTEMPAVQVNMPSDD